MNDGLKVNFIQVVQKEKERGKENYFYIFTRVIFLKSFPYKKRN